MFRAGERRGGMSTALLARCVAAGTLATMTMDAGSTLLARTGLTAGLPPRVIGRWFATLLRGEPACRSILHVASQPGEMALAVAGHYAIGISLTLGFCALVAGAAVRPGPAAAFALALGFGLFTNLLPWLWMFPSMGFGAFGAAAPPELLLLRTSLVNHAVFGLGLGIWTLCLGVVR
jgi:hypothetical protein